MNTIPSWMIISCVLVWFLPAATLGARKRCPEGWRTWPNPVAGTVQNSCFLFYTFGDRTPQKTYGEARAYCQGQGGSMATFLNTSEVDDFVAWVSNPYNGPPGVSGKGSSFMLGYAYLKNKNEPVYEGLSGVASSMFPGNGTHWQDPATGVTQGNIGNVIVLRENSTVGVVPSTWSVTEEQLSNIADATRLNGFVCKKAIGMSQCSKLNQPYISTFGGRAVPLRPYGRYWLLNSPTAGTITIWTTTLPKELDPADPVLIGPPLSPSKDFPQHGPQITYVEFTVDNPNNTAPMFGVYRVDAGGGQYDWFYRNFNTSTDFTVTKMTQGSPVVLASSPDIQAVWQQGGGFSGGWLIKTPQYHLFYDGYDVMVVIPKSGGGTEQRGLCDSIRNRPSNPFFNKDMDTNNKTLNIFTFARGQLRSPQFSPVVAGRPIPCTSSALHDSAIRTCTVLIDPVGTIALSTPPGCFQKGVDIDNRNNIVFHDPIDNIYQACVDSVCAHGQSASCYYIDKLLIRMQRACKLDIAAQEKVRQLANCDTVESSCSSTKNGTVYEGNCYFLANTGSSLFDGQVACNRLASHLPAPKAPAVEEFIVTNFSQPNALNSTWIGVMTSLVETIQHTIPFRKAVATDEAAQLYPRSLKLPDIGTDQCIQMAADGAMDYTSCTEVTDPAAVCTRTMTDPRCPACMFPKRCNTATKACTDPCPGYEVEGRCTTTL